MKNKNAASLGKASSQRMLGAKEASGKKASPYAKVMGGAISESAKEERTPDLPLHNLIGGVFVPGAKEA